MAYPCINCPKSFSTSGDRATHLYEVHNSVTPHLCHVCPKSFANALHLNGHMNVDHSFNSYGSFKVCPHKNCAFQSKTKEIVDRHADTDHELDGARKSKCFRCDFVTDSFLGVSIHLVHWHLNDVRPSCRHCNTVLKTPADVDGHACKARIAPAQVVAQVEANTSNSAVPISTAQAQRNGKRAREENEDAITGVNDSDPGQACKRARVEDSKEQTPICSPPSLTSGSSVKSASPVEDPAERTTDSLLEMQMAIREEMTAQEQTYLKNPKANPTWRKNKKDKKVQAAIEAEATRAAKAKAKAEKQAAREAKAAAKAEVKAAKEAGSKEKLEMKSAAEIQGETSACVPASQSQAGSSRSSTLPTDTRPETTPELVSSPPTSSTSTSIVADEDDDAEFEWEDATHSAIVVATSIECQGARASAPVIAAYAAAGLASNPQAKAAPTAECMPAMEAASTTKQIYRSGSFGLEAACSSMGTAEDVVITRPMTIEGWSGDGEDLVLETQTER